MNCANFVHIHFLFFSFAFLLDRKMLCLHITRYVATAAMRDSWCSSVCLCIVQALCVILNSSAAAAVAAAAPHHFAMKSIVHRTNQTECEVDPVCLKYKSKLRIRSRIYFFFIYSHGWLFHSISFTHRPSLAIFRPLVIFFVVCCALAKRHRRKYFSKQLNANDNNDLNAVSPHRCFLSVLLLLSFSSFAFEIPAKCDRIIE